MIKKRLKENGFRFFDVLTVSFSHFAHDVFSAFLSPILPLIIEKFSISYTAAGLLNVIRNIPTLLNPVFGAIVDRKGGRFLVIIAPTISATAMCLIGLAPNYAILLLLLFTVGLNSTLFHVPSPVMIRYLSGNRVGLGMSFYMVGGEAARTLGPIIVLAGVSAWGLEGIWRLIPLGVASSLFLYWRLSKLPYGLHGVSKIDEKLTKLRRILRKVYKFFAVMMLFLVFRAMLKSALTFYLPTYLQTQGHSLWLSGISLSVLELAGIFGSFFGGTISDHIGRRNTLLISAIAAPIFMFLFLTLDSFWSFPLLILLGLVIFITGPVLLAFTNELKTDRPAFVNSIYMILNFFGTSVASLLVGYFSDKFGIKQSFYLVTYISLGAIPVVLLFKEHKKD